MTGYHLTASTGASRAYACDNCAACSCDCLFDALADAHALTRRHDCDVTIMRVVDGAVLAHTRPYKRRAA